MNNIKRLSVLLFALAIGCLSVLNFSCREAAKNEANQADTLAASAIDAETVINSIMENAANGTNGYYLQKSPIFIQGDYRFTVECFFDGITKLPVLIYEEGNNGEYGSLKNHFLNQQNELYFVSKKVTENIGDKKIVNEYRSYFKDSKLKFAEMRTNDSVEDINKANFKFIEKDVVLQEGLNLEVILPYVNNLMAAAEMNNGFDLYADKVVQLKDGLYFFTVTKSEEINESPFLIKDTSIEKIAKEICLRKPLPKVKVIYHYEGQQCVVDKIEELK